MPGVLWLAVRQATGALFGHYALVPPLDRRAVEAALILIVIPMIGGALLAAGATTAGIAVISAAVVVGIVWAVRDWRTRF